MTTLTPAGVPRLLACSVNFRPVNLHNYMSQFPKINLSPHSPPASLPLSPSLHSSPFAPSLSPSPFLSLSTHSLTFNNMEIRVTYLRAVKNPPITLQLALISMLLHLHIQPTADCIVVLVDTHSSNSCSSRANYVSFGFFFSGEP